MLSKLATLAILLAPALARPVTRAALDLGSCTNPAIEFANGLDGRKQPAFEPEDLSEFNHGSALNIKVITDFICGQLSSKCQAAQDAVDACNQAASDAQSVGGGKTGASADAFNAAFGVTSNFAAVDDSSASGAAAAAAQSDAVAPAEDAALDFGSCANATPEIEFSNGLDGRTEAAFIAVDQNNFNHGSADNIKVITGFICQQLQDNCKASQATIDTCNNAASAAQAAGGGKDGSSADAFNAAFGIQTDFAAGAAASPADVTAAPFNAPDATVAATATASADASTASVDATTVAAAASSSGQNLQTFTGALGGIQAIPVVAGGRGFLVDGTSDLNIGAALQRSCAVQHNQCADAANAGGQDFTVSDCDAQEDACNAAGSQ